MKALFMLAGIFALGGCTPNRVAEELATVSSHALLQEVSHIESDSVPLTMEFGQLQ